MHRNIIMIWIIYRTIQFLLRSPSRHMLILLRKPNFSYSFLNLIYIILAFLIVRLILVFYYFNIALQLILLVFALFRILRLILMEEYFVHNGRIKLLFLDPPHSNYDDRYNKTHHPSNYWHGKGKSLHSSLKTLWSFIQSKRYLDVWPVRLGHAYHIWELFNVDKLFFVWS